MYRYSLFVLLFLSLMICIPVSGHVHKETKAQFIPNHGQWAEEVLYRARLQDAVVYVLQNSLVFVTRDQSKIDQLLSFKYGGGKTKLSDQDFIIPYYAFKITFPQAIEDALWSGGGKKEHYLNYFYPGGKQAGGVPAYDELHCKGIQKGIDLSLYIEDGKLKYLYTLYPGTTPLELELEFDPPARIRKDAAGRLNIPTPLGPVIDEKPLAWTEGAEGKKEVSCAYKVKKSSVTFKVRDKIAPEDTLYIDPILSFASYSGSTADNWGYTATFDEEGFLYTGGIAFDAGDFPVTMGAYQDTFNDGSCDIAISKYDTSGSFLVYSTYLGGTGTEVPSSLIVNNSNELIILGTTGSADFPMEGNSYDTSFNGGTNYTLTNVLGFPNGADLVLCRFSPDGTNLISSTFFGGSGNDGLNMYAPLRRNYADDIRGEVVVDDQDNIFIVSSTSSTDIPTNPGAFQSQYEGGRQDALVACLNRDMAVRIWAAYAGGDSTDAGYSIAFGEAGKIYISGGTISADLNTSGGYQPNYGGGFADGFLMCIAEDGSAMLGATYIGTNLYDQAYFVETDRDGLVYSLGQTGDTTQSFIQNVSWSTSGGGQFISKYSKDLSSRIWSTSWGRGSDAPDVSPSAFMVDLCYNIYLSAWGGPNLNGFGGTSGLPITPDALYNTTDNNDYYFLVLDKDVTQPVFATFYGGSSDDHVDGGTSRFDRRGTIYQAVCAGCQGKDDFPTTPGAWSQVNGSNNCNNAVIKLDFNLPLVVADFSPLSSGCVPYSMQFQNNSSGPGAGNLNYQWDFGDGGSSTLENPMHTYNSSGIYPVRLIAGDTGACNVSDTISRYVVVLSGESDTLSELHVCEGELVHLGLPPSPDTSISYQWSPATGLSDATVPNPLLMANASQNYSLIVSNGICADTFSQDVTVHVVDVDLGSDTSICSDTVLLQAAVNKPGLSFHWSSQPDFTNILNTDLSADSLEIVISGPETIYIRVDDGYCQEYDSINIDFLILTSPLVSENPSCAGECDGSLSASVSGGTAPYSFLWNNGAQSNTIDSLCAGNYSITITDADGCVSIQQSSLIDPDSVKAFLQSTNIPCLEACVGSIEALASGGTPPYSYQWSDGQTSNLASALCEGNYELTVTDLYGCDTEVNADIELDWVFEDFLTTPIRDTIYRGQETYLEITELPGISYQWVPFEGLSDPNSSATWASPDQSTTYIVTAEDAYGCLYVDSVSVVVTDVICNEPYIFIPNAFTPNGDNLNDRLFVRSAVASDVHLMVYDRWGEKVFETKDQSEGWDGTFRGKDCDPGVFVYYLEVTCFDEQVFEKKGNVTLIR